MNRPDLIVIGFGNSVMSVDPLEAICSIPPFKRATNHLHIYKEMVRYSDVSVLTITIDDPDFTSDDLYVIFYTSPTERQHERINNTVLEIEKRITAWFHGTLYLVDHTPYSTRCTIRKRMIGEDDVELESPVESSGSISDVFRARDIEIANGREEAQGTAQLPI